MTTDSTSALDTLSVLFTDVVASTELRSRLGDDAADQFQRVHDELVSTAIRQCGGTLVKSLGDGVLATFGAAADAVSSAVAVQQAVDVHSRRSPQLAFDVRVGVSIGDVAVEEGDVHGTPVVEAARLCAAASTGEILVAELVRMLARGRGGFRFEPLGELELKGLPEPVPACRVLWEPLVVAGVDPDIPLPGALGSLTSTPYIGRKDLLASLSTACAEAQAGKSRTILLAGEPGVGKTRTAAEVALAARESGALVLFGRCDEDLGVPYQPFVEALDWYVRNVPRTRLGRLPGELSRLVPELPTLVPDLPAPVSSDPRSEEYRLFEAVGSWLVDVAAGSGLVLIVDDLHWAARPTLQLLTHAVRAAAQGAAGLVVLATYRDTDVDRAHPLATMLSDLRRLPHVERIAIRGLTREEVIALVERAAGHKLDEDALQLAVTLHTETEGNPFFVTEVLRHLVETGGVHFVDDRWVVAEGAGNDVPEGVRDVVGRRLSRLSDAANSALSVAAVIGRDAGIDVVVAVSGLTEDNVLDALDEAIRARLLEEIDADHFRFSHALVRTTLYDELSATRRRSLHRRVSEAIEKLHPHDVVALARHTLQAGPDGGNVSRAARYSIAAGEQALAGRALADAETRFRQALELLEDADAPDEELEIAATCGLGEAERDQGNPVYRETLVTAARTALASGLTDLLVRAVLSNDRGIVSIVTDVDEELVELIEAALDALGPAPCAERALLLARLAAEVTWAGDHARRRRLVNDAESLARQLGDATTLAHVLMSSSMAAVNVEELDRYAARSLEAVEIADRLGDPALRALTRMYWNVALVAEGRIDDARQTGAEMVAAAEDASPGIRWVARSQSVVFAILSGDLAAARTQNDELLAIGQALGEPDCLNWWAGITAAIAWVSGLEAQLADFAGELADRYPRSGVWRVAHIWWLLAAKRSDEARAVITQHPLDLSDILEEPFPFIGPCQIAGIARELEDHQLAEAAMQVLEPYRGKWAHYWLGVFGPVERCLGWCALTLGDHDRAIADFEAALEAAETQDCPVLANLFVIDLADALSQRADGDDLARARQLLEEVLPRVQAAGASGVEERARALLGALD